MTVSFVILNYKSKLLTRECVKGILHADLPFEFEIIVVDNASDDGVGDLIQKKFSGVTFIQLDANIGMGPGINKGIETAQGKYIYILNPDTVLTAQSINPLVQFMDIHPRAGIAAPKLLNPDATHQPSVHTFPQLLMPFFRRTIVGKTSYGKKYLSQYTVAAQELERATMVDWVFGPAFMIRKKVAEEMGGYDEQYFLFFEDTDLCRRIWKQGNEVWYVPEATVVHYPHRLSGHSEGLKSLLKKTTWYHILSWLKYFWKWRGEANPHTT